MSYDPQHEGLPDPGEEALREVLAGLDAGEELETLLSRRPDEADAIRERIRAERGDDPVVFLPPDPPSIPGFRCDRLLGRGGMGEVWLAEREADRLRVALKIVRDGSLTPERRVRIRREAEALAAVEHSGVVRVHGAGEEEGAPWIAVEYVPGRGLDEILADRTL